MAQLDQGYLSSLVRNVQDGDADAFAELYAATCQSEYRLACKLTNDTKQAEKVLQELYIFVFRQINTLKNPDLFISWLDENNSRLCSDITK